MIEQRNNDFGMQVKANLLKRHSGRELLVYRQVQNKQEEIHEIHKDQIIRNLDRHE